MKHLKMSFSLLVMLTSLFFSACSSSEYETEEYAPEEETSMMEETTLPPEGENEQESLDESSGLMFHGESCTYDCSGHEAGYQWAEDNAVSDSSDCDGNSDSFNEGCQSYVEEN